MLIFPMCSTDFTCVSCVNGSTIQSVLRELLLIDGKLMGFRIKLFKKQFVCLLFSVYSFITLVRASDISRKKKQNFAGFSGANSRKNRPISRDFRGKKVKIRGTIGRFRAIFEGEKSKFEKNRPISPDFSGKKSSFEGFSGANS